MPVEYNFTEPIAYTHDQHAIGGPEQYNDVNLKETSFHGCIVMDEPNLTYKIGSSETKCNVRHEGSSQPCSGTISETDFAECNKGGILHRYSIVTKICHIANFSKVILLPCY